MADYHSVSEGPISLLLYIIFGVIMQYWIVLGPLAAGLIGYWLGVRRGFAQSQEIMREFRYSEEDKRARANDN